MEVTVMDDPNCGKPPRQKPVTNEPKNITRNKKIHWEDMPQKQ